MLNIRDISPPSDFRGVFRQDPDARAVYSEAAGIGQIIPWAVAVPVDAADVAALVSWAALQGIPLVPRGSGSSMAGGAIGSGLIVDLSSMKHLGAVDAGRRTIRCGPGALRNSVDEAARAVGLTFPVDPSSGAYCTVGGMAATNSAGAHTLRYGSMRAWVEALDCVFADGTRAEVRRGAPLAPIPVLARVQRATEDLLVAEAFAPSRHAGVSKESSGYGLHAFAQSCSPVDLLVGSEGTLALIVGLELRLAPREAASASLLAAFASLDDAVSAAVLARQGGASACELLDRTFLDVARDGGANVPVPSGTEAVLLTAIEGTSSADVNAVAAILEESFRTAGATDVALALDAATEHAMWELRHAASPILGRLHPSLKSMQFIEDGCVPLDKLADYVKGVRSALDRQGIRGVIFGHAGDAHMHVNPLVDVRLPDWRSRISALLDEVTTLVARLGGTISGEHGDGRLRAPLLDRVWPAETLERFRAVKQTFDPDGILNPGVKIPLDDSLAVDRVKYDPSLGPLSPAARAVLARVERERAYSRPRLELLSHAQSGAG